MKITDLPDVMQEELDQLLSLSKNQLHVLKIPTTECLGRELDIDAISDCLYKKRLNNCLLVAEAGVGKTCIIEEVSLLLKTKIVLELSVANSLAGTQYRGQFEEKIGSVLSSIALFNQRHTATPIVLFIDEIHTIMSVGKGDGGGLNMADIFKPLLSRGEIQIIGATTPNEYANTISGNSPMVRRFSVVRMHELSQEVCKQIVENFWTVNYPNIDLDPQIIRLILRYGPRTVRTSSPDCLVEMADRILARATRTGDSVDAQLVQTVLAEYLVPATKRQVFWHKVKVFFFGE